MSEFSSLMFFQVYLYMLYEISFYHGFTGIYSCRVSREPSKNGGGITVMVPGTKTWVPLPQHVPDWQNGKMCVFLYPLLQAMSDVSAVISAFSKDHHKVRTFKSTQNFTYFWSNSNEIVNGNFSFTGFQNLKKNIEFVNEFKPEFKTKNCQ